MSELTLPQPVIARPPANLLSALRHATRDKHESLDRRLSPPAVWSISDYERLLRMTLSIVAPLEERINRLWPAFSSPVNSRANALRDDLAAIGSADDIVDVPLPAVESEADAYGAAYVLQGSMLGGAVISRALSRDLALPASAMSYLHNGGEDVAISWRRFLADLNAFEQRSDPSAHVRAVQSARATFDAFAAALTALESQHN